MRRSSKSERSRAGFVPGVAPKLSRAQRRRREARKARRQTGSRFALRQEQLERRLALAVNVSGFQDAIDYAGRRLIDGVAVIASDSGDDLFIKQVATVATSPLAPPGSPPRQDLIVADNGSFLDYTPIHDIDAYHGIFVTNATARSDAFVPADRVLTTQTTFLVTREELTGTFFGTLSYLQADGTRSQWDFNSVGFTTGPGVSGPLAPGYIYPLSIFLSANPNSAEGYEQSQFTVIWSDVPASLDRIRVDSITYLHTDNGLALPTFGTDGNLGMNCGELNTVRFTLPGAFAATDDGNTLHESLGVVQGSLAGRLSFIWTGGIPVSFDFRSDAGSFPEGAVSGNVLFAQPGFGEFNSYAAVDLGAYGWISVQDGRIENGVLTVSVYRWDDLDDFIWTDPNLVDRPTFLPFLWSRAVPGVPGPAFLQDVSYLTYSRDQVPNEATFFPGQTITREVTVDLLAPASTVNIDSPIRVSNALQEDGGTDGGPPTSGGDVDLRATNVNVRATTTAPDRFFIGHSQSSATNRLTTPAVLGGEENYLVTPSLPGFYNGTGLPGVATAEAIVEVSPAGEVTAVLLPEGFGFGYDPDRPPVVRIAAPAPGGRQATAVANVAADGRITGFTVTDPGAGYNVGWSGVRPIATVEAAIGAVDGSARVAQIDVASGSVVRIDVLDTGNRYHAPPRIVIDPPAPGDDSRVATARSFIDAEGRLTAIEVVDPGSGYRARPVVRVQPQSPAAYAETVRFLADVSSNIYEMYVGDDLGTPVPRGIVALTAEGRLSAAGLDVQIATLAVPISRTRETFTISAASIPPGFDPTGLVISGRGIKTGTRVLRWEAATNTVTVARGSVSLLSVPSFAVFESGANSLYLEATTADVFIEGQFNAVKQSYLLNSDQSRGVLAPFVLTTASPITGTQTGVIEGSEVNITLGNDAPTALTGATAYQTVDLQTRVNSLRTTAAVSQANPRGAFPYDLTIRSLQDIQIDAVAASSRTIAIESLGSITFQSAVDTQGDLRIEARADDPDDTATFTVTSPVSTTRGQISISADSVEVRNSVIVSAAAVDPGRDDIFLEARRGSLLLQANVSAVNEVILRQANGSANGSAIPGEIDGDLARVTAEGVEVLAEGGVRLRTDAVTLSGSAGTGFTVSELNDISIPLLSSGGLVSLEALGVDPGPDGVNPRALIANLLDVTQLVVNVPSGSAFVEANTDGRLLIGNAVDIQAKGALAKPMMAAGDVVIRSLAGDVVVLDTPLAGESARAVRAVTLGRLPSTTSYSAGTPGVMPSVLSGTGSINSLVDGGGGPLWGFDAFGRPISLIVGDRVLVNRQVDQPGTPRILEERENGVYVVSKVGGGALGSSRWELTRSADTDTTADAMPNTLVRVLEGPLAGRVFAMRYDVAPRTLAERVTGNVLQLPEFFPAFDLLTIGQAVTGTGIVPNSFISSIDRDARTVTLDVLDPGQFYTAAPAGLVSVGWSTDDVDKLVFDASFLGFNNLAVEQEVFGEGIDSGAKIASIDSLARTVTISKADGSPGALPLEIGLQTIGRSLGTADVLGATAATVTVPVDTSWLGDVVLDQRIDFLDDLGTRFASSRVTARDAGTGVIDFQPIAAEGTAAVSSGSLVTVSGNYVALSVSPTTSWLGDVVIGQAIVLQDSSGNAIARRTITAVNAATGRIDFGGVLTSGGVPQNVVVGPSQLPTTVRLLPDYETVPVTQAVAATFVSRVVVPAGRTIGDYIPRDGQRIVLFDASEDPFTSRIVKDTAVVAGPDLDSDSTPDFYDITVTLTTQLSLADQSRVAAWYGMPVATVRIGAVVPTDSTAVLGAPDRLALPGFTNYGGLFVGQLVTGAGILSGAVITAIDGDAGTIDVTPNALPRDLGPVAFLRRLGNVLTMPDTFEVADVHVGQRAEFLDGTGAVVGRGFVLERNLQTGSVTFRDVVPGAPLEVRFLPVATVGFGIDGPGAVPVTWNLWTATNVTPGRPELLTLPTFIAFDELSLGLEVYGPNIPLGATIAGIDAANRQVTLSATPLPGAVTQVSFAVGPTALHPAPTTLTLPASFTHWSRLYPGQQVYGAGIAADAIITAVNPNTRTVTLTPGAVAPGRANVAVAQANDSKSPFYPEGYDDWLELGAAFNDYADIVIGQRVEFFNAAGALIGNGLVTAIDPMYRTVGLNDGALDGIASDVVTIALLPVFAVRFGATKSLGTGYVEFSLPPVGAIPIDFVEQTVVTNIGTDLSSKTVTYVVSTAGTTNSTTGSLGKMIRAFQENDVAEAVTEVAVLSATLTFARDATGALILDGAGDPIPDGGVILQLDSLFTGFDRLVLDADVVGTARLFTREAKLVGYDGDARTVTLSPGSLSVLGLANPERIDRLRLTVTTLNPEQATDFRFWAYGSGNIKLTQELPVITKPMVIDGRRISGDGLVNVTPTLSRVVVDGQRITRTRAGRLAAGGEQVNGIEIIGLGAAGTRVGGLSVGGFLRGSSIKIDSASQVVVESVRVGSGLTPTTRLPTISGITVTGRRAEVSLDDADQNVVRLRAADRATLLAVAVGKTVMLRDAADRSLGQRTVAAIDASALELRFTSPVPRSAANIVLVAEDNTILNSFVGGGTGAAITIDGSSRRTYVVGTEVGNSSVDSVVGIFVESSGNFIGVDAIASPLFTGATMTRANPNQVAVSRTIFTSKTPLIGLSVAGQGIAAGTRVVGIDSVSSVLYLDKPVTIAAERSSNSITLGHMGTRSTVTDTIELDRSVPLDEVFVGQAIRGDGIQSNTTIVAIDRPSRRVTVSRPLLTDGVGFVTFASPNGRLRNVVQNNRKGIVLRGDNNRVTNTDVINNSSDGIEIVHGTQVIGQRIGTQTATGTAASDGGFLLASWGVTVPTVQGSKTLTLPVSFADAGVLRVGMTVHGNGITAGTKIARITSPSAQVRNWTLELSAPFEASANASSIAFGLTTSTGVPLRWKPESSTADVARLFVGQSVHGQGLPEYTRITAIRTPNGTNGLLILSTPLAGLPAAARNFGAIAFGAGMRMAEVSPESNAFYGIGGYGIRITKNSATGGTDVSLNRIARNRFAVNASGAEAAANRNGAIVVVPPSAPFVPTNHVPTPYSKTDRLGNQFGLGTLPGTSPSSGGSGRKPGPGIPKV
jgi:hypothetical protein